MGGGGRGSLTGAGVIIHHPLHVKTGGGGGGGGGEGMAVVVFKGATGQHSVPLLRAVTERSHWRLVCVQTAVRRHQAVYNSATVT